MAGTYHQLLWNGVVTVPVATKQELCDEARNRSRVRIDSDPRDVSNRGSTQLPRGLWLLLRRPARSRIVRRDHPPKGPVLKDRARKDDAAAGSERARQSPPTLLIGAAPPNGIT